MFRDEQHKIYQNMKPFILQWEENTGTSKAKILPAQWALCSMSYDTGLYFIDFYLPKPLLLPLILSIWPKCSPDVNAALQPHSHLQLVRLLIKCPKHTLNTRTAVGTHCKDLRQNQLVTLWKGNHSRMIIDKIFLHEMDLNVPKMVTGCTATNPSHKFFSAYAQ